MSSRNFLPRAREWFLRSAALREARDAASGPRGRRARAHAQAQLLAEVARRVAEPVEALPNGSRAAVQLSLYRDASYWALTAIQPDDADAADLPTLWTRVPAARIEQAAGGAEAAESLRRTLANGAPASALDVTDEDAARASTFANALIAELDAPQRRVDRISLQRWLRLGLAGLAVLVIAYGLRVWALGPNLVEHKPWRTSSAYSGCTASSPCEGIFFHTNQEDNPWIEFDLQGVKPVKRVEVANRPDCCEDRAVPLIVEVSTDQKNWTEVAKRETDFTTWTASFPKKTARYVRLRVPRATQFHLKDVVVR